jgi:hypothetical protein
MKINKSLLLCIHNRTKSVITVFSQGVYIVLCSEERR